MDPELLRLLLALFESQGDAGNGSPDNSPYAPELTGYLDNYYSAIDQGPQAANTSGGVSTGAPAANPSEVKTINGEPYIPPEFIGAHGPWIDHTTPRGIPPSPAANQPSFSGRSDTSGRAFPGAQGPIHFEDGSTAPGELPLGTQLQMVAAPFQQYPAGGSRAPLAVMSILAGALQQAGQPGRAGTVPVSRGGPSIQHSSQMTPTQKGMAAFQQVERAGRQAVGPITHARVDNGGDQGNIRATPSQPQRQYSAPAPVYTPSFTPAPASRAAAQNSLAQTLNTMRSLNRR